MGMVRPVIRSLRHWGLGGCERLYLAADMYMIQLIVPHTVGPFIHLVVGFSLPLEVALIGKPIFEVQRSRLGSLASFRINSSPLPPPPAPISYEFTVCLALSSQDHSLWVAGEGTSGQLGQGSPLGNSATLVKVTLNFDGMPISAISAGSLHMGALAVNQYVFVRSLTPHLLLDVYGGEARREEERTGLRDVDDPNQPIRLLPLPIMCAPIHQRPT